MPSVRSAAVVAGAFASVALAGIVAGCSRDDSEIATLDQSFCEQMAPVGSFDVIPNTEQAALLATARQHAPDDLGAQLDVLVVASQKLDELQLTSGSDSEELAARVTAFNQLDTQTKLDALAAQGAIEARLQADCNSISIGSAQAVSDRLDANIDGPSDSVPPSEDDLETVAAERLPLSEGGALAHIILDQGDRNWADRVTDIEVIDDTSFIVTTTLQASDIAVDGHQLCNAVGHYARTQGHPGEEGYIIVTGADGIYLNFKEVGSPSCNFGKPPFV